MLPQSCAYDEELNVWSANQDLADQYGLAPMSDELRAKLEADEKARLGKCSSRSSCSQLMH